MDRIVLGRLQTLDQKQVSIFHYHMDSCYRMFTHNKTLDSLKMKNAVEKKEETPKDGQSSTNMETSDTSGTINTRSKVSSERNTACKYFYKIDIFYDFYEYIFSK